MSHPTFISCEHELGYLGYVGYPSVISYYNCFLTILFIWILMKMLIIFTDDLFTVILWWGFNWMVWVLFWWCFVAEYWNMNVQWQFYIWNWDHMQYLNTNHWFLGSYVMYHNTLWNTEIIRLHVFWKTTRYWDTDICSCPSYENGKTTPSSA